MEPIKQKSKLYSQIRDLIEGLDQPSYPFTFTYCEGLGKPLFTFTVDKTQEDFFVDKNGQKWVKASE
jgi:hypothetical protein